LVTCQAGGAPAARIGRVLLTTCTVRREPRLAAGRLVSWRYDFWLRDDDAGEIPAHASVT